MKNFEFKQVDGAFRWESDFLALEFSHPSIQGYSEFVHLTSEKEIMYYYYTVKVFKKVSEWDDEDNDVSKWELISERFTHDFPTIFQLKWLLNTQLNDNTIVNGQKVDYYNGTVRYTKVMATDGFACDDFYEIRKSVDSISGDERYIVYCGTTFDYQGDLNSVGLRTPYVSREDIEELLACVMNFICFSLEEHNKELKCRVGSYEVKNGKIYEYAVLDDSIDKNRIESIYVVGDCLDITTVVDNKEQEYNKVVIEKIDREYVFLNTEQIIQGDSIMYISNEPTKDMLTYKEQDIAKDFVVVLSDEEKDEFREASVESLVEKYKMAIIDRTWMCRDEHEFEMDYHAGDRVKEVTPIVKEVICMIKDYIK